MIDWKVVNGFEWDEGNSRKNAEKHNVTQSDSEQVYFNQPLFVLADVEHSHQEACFHALGKTDNARLLHITFTLRSGNRLIRMISARDMSRKERKIYEQIEEDS